jgi:hypothetical protein
MRNLFIGRSQTWLEEQLAAAQEELANGSTLQQGGAGDAQAGFVVQGRPEERIKNLLFALWLKDPVTYPAADCNPATRTQVVFRD